MSGQIRSSFSSRICKSGVLGNFGFLNGRAQLGEGDSRDGGRLPAIAPGIFSLPLGFSSQGMSERAGRRGSLTLNQSSSREGSLVVS